MYQSNRSFNIPLGQPPGHLNFWKIFVEIPPSRAKKLFKCLIIGPFQVIKCPHSRENYQIFGNLMHWFYGVSFHYLYTYISIVAHVLEYS